MRIKPLQLTLLLGPSLVLTLLLLVLPLVVVALMSLTDWQFGAASWNWIGLGNYADLWNDTTFRKSFANGGVAWLDRNRPGRGAPNRVA